MTMKKETEGRKNVSGLIVLLVLGVFALCVIGVLLSGVETYKELNERDQTVFNERTCVQYITTKVRQAEDAGSVETADVGGTTALVFKDYIDGEEYLTYIYCYDGWLCEYFGSKDSADVSEIAGFGEKLIPVYGFYPEISQGNLYAEIIMTESGDDKSDIHLNIYLRTGEEGHYEE